MFLKDRVHTCRLNLLNKYSFKVIGLHRERKNEQYFQIQLVYYHFLNKGSFCQNIHNSSSCVKINILKLFPDRPLPLPFTQTNQTKLAPKLERVYTYTVTGAVFY